MKEPSIYRQQRFIATEFQILLVDSRRTHTTIPKRPNEESTFNCVYVEYIYTDTYTRVYICTLYPRDMCNSYLLLPTCVSFVVYIYTSLFLLRDDFFASVGFYWRTSKSSSCPPLAFLNFCCFFSPRDWFTPGIEYTYTYAHSRVYEIKEMLQRFLKFLSWFSILYKLRERGGTCFWSGWLQWCNLRLHWS